MQALDLLTDFVGRPHIDAGELDRERGVVIQEIARAHDQPATLAEHLIDRAAFGEHPLGRPVLGPEEHLRTFTRDAVVGFRERRWAGERGGAFLVATSRRCRQRRGGRALRALPHAACGGELRAGAAVRAEHARGGARVQAVAPAHVLPAGDRRDRARPARRAGHLRHAAGRLDGLAPVRRDPRAAGPGLLGLLGDHAFADVPILQLSAGLDSEKCIEAYRRMRGIVDELRADGPREEEVERARSYAAGRSSWPSRTPTRWPATAPPAHRLRRGHRPRHRGRAPGRRHLRRGGDGRPGGARPARDRLRGPAPRRGVSPSPSGGCVPAPACGTLIGRGDR